MIGKWLASACVIGSRSSDRAPSTLCWSRLNAAASNVPEKASVGHAASQSPHSMQRASSTATDRRSPSRLTARVGQVSTQARHPAPTERVRTHAS